MSTLKRVLIVHPYGIGDFLFVTPVLRALRLVPTIEKVDLLLGSRTSETARANPHVDEIFVVDKDLFHRRGRGANLNAALKLGLELRQRRYNLMLDYSFRGEYAFFGRTFMGIPKTAGFDRKRRGFFHTVRLPVRGFEGRHVTDYYCELAEKAGVPVAQRFLEFYLQKADRESARSKRAEAGVKKEGRYLVVAPGGGESWGKDAHFKRWPVPYFADLSARLIAQLGLDGVWIAGSGSEKPLCAELCGLLKNSLDLSGKLSLGETAALIADAVLFLGNDGGLMHMAHALRIPVVALFGPVDPAVYGPYPPASTARAVYDRALECRPCYQNFRYKSDCARRECLQAFSPDAVWQELQTSGFFQALR